MSIGGERIDMKTSKEVLSKAHLDDTVWGKAIIEAEARYEEDARSEGFTVDDCTRAGDWTTCACGNVDPELIRDGGAPYDYDLEALGVLFSDFVESDEFVAAAHTLIRIEDRAAALAENPWLHQQEAKHDMATYQARQVYVNRTKIELRVELRDQIYADEETK